MVSVIKSAVLLILSVFSSLSFSLGHSHRFLLNLKEHSDDVDHKKTDLVPHKDAVTLPWLKGGDHVESKISGNGIPEIHSLCNKCKCGGSGGESSTGIPLLGDIPLIGKIPLIGEIPEILGIPIPREIPQNRNQMPVAQQSPKMPLVQNQGVPVCSCCGERCGGTCGCDGHGTGKDLEEAKNNKPIPPR